MRGLRLLLAALVSCTLALPASATWSIVFVNKLTGEVAVATATCIPGEDLREFVPVVRVGKGAGAAQYIVAINAVNRKIMRNGLRDGLTPAEIKAELITGSGTAPGRRQYGIAALNGPAASWTGGQVDPGKLDLTGEVGELSYAIQGNSLTGPEVIEAAELALVVTKGDSGERMIEAMKAAMELGGDGRCSCNNLMPTSCGVPPPNFRKSAHVVVMIVSRFGDTDGNCNGLVGCANGDYYLDLEFIGSQPDNDPVLELEAIYDDWRASMSGRPDHVQSVVETSATKMPADGSSSIEVTVRLADIDGFALGKGGDNVRVDPLDSTAPLLVDVTNVTDNGDGTYTFKLVATNRVGTQDLVVTIDDGIRPVRLYPDLSVELEEPVGLNIGSSAVSLSASKPIPLIVNEPLAPGGTFLLLGSLSGTSPGIPIAGVTLQLNPDAFFMQALNGQIGLSQSVGALDASGRAVVHWLPNAKLIGTVSGTSVSWAALTYDGVLRATNAVTVGLGL